MNGTDDIRNLGLDEYMHRLSDEEVVRGIIKYRTISNAWKSVAMLEMAKKHNTKTPPKHESTNEFIDELRDILPEYFL